MSLCASSWIFAKTLIYTDACSITCKHVVYRMPHERKAPIHTTVPIIEWI